MYNDNLSTTTQPFFRFGPSTYLPQYLPNGRTDDGRTNDGPTTDEKNSDEKIPTKKFRRKNSDENGWTDGRTAGNGDSWGGFAPQESPLITRALPPQRPCLAPVPCPQFFFVRISSSNFFRPNFFRPSSVRRPSVRRPSFVVRQVSPPFAPPPPRPP